MIGRGGHGVLPHLVIRLVQADDQAAPAVRASRSMECTITVWPSRT
jgi:hypothetical protein